MAERSRSGVWENKANSAPCQVGRGLDAGRGMLYKQTQFPPRCRSGDRRSREGRTCETKPIGEGIGVQGSGGSDLIPDTRPLTPALLCGTKPIGRIGSVARGTGILPVYSRPGRPCYSWAGRPCYGGTADAGDWGSQGRAGAVCWPDVAGPVGWPVRETMVERRDVEGRTL